MLMEIFTKYIKTISTLVAITVGIVTIYFYFHKECVILEVKAMSVQLLTESTSTDDLRVQYFYKDTIPVQNVKLNHYIAVFERVVLLCKICEQQTSNRIESLAIESGCIRE